MAFFIVAAVKSSNLKQESSSSSEKTVPVGVLEPSQPTRLVGPGRGVGPVGPRGIQGATGAKQTLVEETVPSDCNLLWIVIEENKSGNQSGIQAVLCKI
jgi:hypothetical protein